VVFDSGASVMRIYAGIGAVIGRLAKTRLRAASG